MLFIDKIKNIVKFENLIEENQFNIDIFKRAKKLGFSDKYIAKVWEVSEEKIYEFRKTNNIFPVYKMIDTCASEFESYVPYF